MIRTVAALTLLLLAGCAAMPDAGPYDLHPDTVKKVRPKMGTDQVREILGPPFSRTELSEGRQLWTYRFRIETDGKRSTYRSLAAGEPTRPDGIIYVLFFTDGTVATVYRG